MITPSARALLAAALLATSIAGARAQTYRNLVNTRFRTVSGGPMQATVVDVAAGAGRAAVVQAAADRVAPMRAARATAVRRQLDALRRLYPKRRLTLGVPDIVVARAAGRLVRAPVALTRAAGQDITFDLPTTGDGSWTTAQAAELTTVIGVLYPALKAVYGDPSWSGSVRVTNGDNTTPIIGDPDAISGGVYVVSARQIIFPQFNSPQSRVLNLAQMMAIAFRGDASISYDAWERGMARAGTILAVSAALPQLESLYGTGSIDVTDPLWMALDRYDLLNQAALGSDRFYPASAVNGIANTVTFPNMLIPRVMMCGTAWLKVATEDPSFLRSFNAAYYTALAANAGVRDSVPDLRAIARQALTGDGTPQVEGADFDAWYEQQFALDTSVTQGDKLYAMASALRPASAADDDYAVGIVVYYYRTGPDTSGEMGEVNLNGTIYPIYWENTYQDRLFLAAQYERIDILAGVGTVAPTFLNTLGGDPALQSRMRVTIELPVAGQVTRLSLAPRSMGVLGAANNCWGAVVGADDGKVTIATESGITQELTVAQGAFGGSLDALAFSRRGRTTVTFTPSGGGAATVRHVVTGPAEFVGVIQAANVASSVRQSLPAGLSMVSFPIRPFRAKASDALVSQTTGLPIFTEDNLLMARWRQSAAGSDKYERFPAMEAIQPGAGYWLNLAADTPFRVDGTLPNLEPFSSIGLTYGWNQIGNPYSGLVNVSNLRVQYMADNVPATLDEAVARGWIDAPVVTGSTGAAIWGYTAANGYQPASTMEAWFGYWIRVPVSEGVTLTFPRPGLAVTAASRSVRASSTASRAAAARGGWSVDLRLSGPGGRGASAVLAQSPGATSGYDRGRDALLPPVPVSSVPALSFPHDDWGVSAGDYYADVRSPSSSDPWVLRARTPVPNSAYTLTWALPSALPRSVRLVLTDLSTGRRQYLQTTSGYTFTQGVSASRDFRVSVERRDRTALRISGLVARVSRAAGSRTVEIGYELSQGATVDARIRAGNGGVLRTLTPGRAVPSGASTLLWDTRDDRGIHVPTGMYLIELAARTTEGDAARVVLPVTVVR